MKYNVKYFKQAQVDDTITSSTSFILVLEEHQISYVWYALSKAIFAVTNYLIFHVHLHSFQENLLCDHVEHQGETDQPLVR